MSVPIILGLFIPIIVAFLRNHKKNFICVLCDAFNITIVNCFINHFWTAFFSRVFSVTGRLSGKYVISREITLLIILYSPSNCFFFASNSS